MESSAAASACSAAGARGRSTTTTGIVLRLRLPRAWTPEEDARLGHLAAEHGHGHWHRVARQMAVAAAAAPGGRSARACRDRWRHHLARDVYRRPFTARDDEELRRLVAAVAAHRLGGGGGGRRWNWKEVARAVYMRTSRVMKRRWREIRERAPAAAAKEGGGSPGLPSDDDESDEDMGVAEATAGEPTTAMAQQGPRCYADDVLLVSCNLAMGGWAHATEINSAT